MKSFECLTKLDKTVKVNLSYGQSKDKLLSRVSAYDDIKFVSEKQYVKIHSIMKYLKFKNNLILFLCSKNHQFRCA